MNIEFVYGGSFDPLHIGHSNLVKELVFFLKQGMKEKSIKSKEVVFRFLPCAIPALKGKTSASFDERVDRLNLAFEPFFKCHNIEMLIDSRENLKAKVDGKKSYTIDSLRGLHQEDESVIRFFIIGADNLVNMHQWKDYKDIPRYCNLIIINRPGYEVIDFKKTAGSYGFLAEENNDLMLKKNQEVMGRCFYFPIKGIDVSSTVIKEKIENNQSVEEWLVN